MFNSYHSIALSSGLFNEEQEARKQSYGSSAAGYTVQSTQKEFRIRERRMVCQQFSVVPKDLLTSPWRSSTKGFSLRVIHQTKALLAPKIHRAFKKKTHPPPLKTRFQRLSSPQGVHKKFAWRSSKRLKGRTTPLLSSYQVTQVHDITIFADPQYT